MEELVGDDGWSDNAGLVLPARGSSPMITRAVSTWSLHRTLGRYAADDSAFGGGPFIAAPADPNGLPLMELPAKLAEHGYDAVQICHFHIPSRDADYIAALREQFAVANVVVDAILVDDGDLTGTDADAAEAWIGGWLDTARDLGAHRVRVGAGFAHPTPERLRESAVRLVRLAISHPEVRVITENWHELLDSADAVNTLLDETGDRVGLLIDLGNWSGPDKYEQLAQIAARAEACHAKCRFDGSGPDKDDYRRALQVLQDAGFDGPMVLIYDGPSDDEWGMLDVEWNLVQQVFA
jgi:sugar phosphate isomerase/epimerase